MLADKEKPDSWEAAAVTAHNFSSPSGNGWVNKCQPSWGSVWVWRATRCHRGKRNTALLLVCSMLEAPVPLHDSFSCTKQQPLHTVALQEPQRGRGELRLMEQHWETSLHAGIYGPGTTWASCSSQDLLRGRAFTQLMAELSLPKQVKI